ncbi:MULTISPECIES: hypothetical protein [Cytobacillus]|nr:MULTISPECIES: hypothetical protein [Cytobacillus]KAF0817120.1 putative carbohydrate kinase [Bacillus sp. ZZV12-4809]MCM3092128.1 hypothetical protein [Cytobacillus sp. AMY 15.2]MCM3707564.1 hypothetical protein [Cytobacillus firmus]
MTTKQKRKSFQRLTLKPKKDIEEIKLGIKLGDKRKPKIRDWAKEMYSYI